MRAAEPNDNPGAPAIELIGLEKTYAAQKGQPEKRALKGVDLAVPQGSIFGLLGPNGAGKSTMINILAGLVDKSAGRARVLGIDIDERPRLARRSIGVVPQELNLDPFFTPREVLEIQAGLYGVPKKARITEEILRSVGLLDKADAHARSLSGGMRRRLLVGKALVHRPGVVILDEPTAGVDVELRRSLWARMRELNARGVTVVLTTHYLEEAEEMCDRIAIVDRGRIVACEPTSALIAKLDEKALIVTPARPLDAPPAGLASDRAEIDARGRLVLRYAPSRADVGALLERIRAAEVEIKELETREADLEEVFLRLTGERDAEENDDVVTARAS